MYVHIRRGGAHAYKAACTGKPTPVIPMEHIAPPLSCTKTPRCLALSFRTPFTASYGRHPLTAYVLRSSACAGLGFRV